jgi:hypothetical protein
MLSAGRRRGQALRRDRPCSTWTLRASSSTKVPNRRGSAAGFPAAAATDARAKATRLWTSTFNSNGDLAPADRTYLARLIAAQTGTSQADVEKRVNDVIVEAKAAADRARKGAAKLPSG